VLDADTSELRIHDGDGNRLSFVAVFDQLETNPSFVGFWTATLRQLPFPSYCWECPPLTRARLSEEFVCVFVSSPLLLRQMPDPSPFASFFINNGAVCADFDNLGGDAHLVVPVPDGSGRNLAHLARFVAEAPAALSVALWSRLARCLRERLGDGPIWISTAGLGVAWLHVRLDSVPKYYRHTPYRRLPDSA